jgi:hypothetical protein
MSKPILVSKQYSTLPRAAEIPIPLFILKNNDKNCEVDFLATIEVSLALGSSRRGRIILVTSEEGHEAAKSIVRAHQVSELWAASTQGTYVSNLAETGKTAVLSVTLPHPVKLIDATLHILRDIVSDDSDAHDALSIQAACLVRADDQLAPTRGRGRRRE